jgi:hypothetical protein
MRVELRRKEHGMTIFVLLQDFHWRLAGSPAVRRRLFFRLLRSSQRQRDRQAKAKAKARANNNPKQEEDEETMLSSTMRLAARQRHAVSCGTNRTSLQVEYRLPVE